jgi:hypothetical protein
MRFLLTDVSNNIPIEEDCFSKIVDERIGFKGNNKKVCKNKTKQFFL